MNQALGGNARCFFLTGTENVRKSGSRDACGPGQPAQCLLTLRFGRPERLARQSSLPELGGSRFPVATDGRASVSRRPLEPWSFAHRRFARCSAPCLRRHTRHERVTSPLQRQGEAQRHTCRSMPSDAGADRRDHIVHAQRKPRTGVVTHVHASTEARLQLTQLLSPTSSRPGSRQLAPGL